MRTLGVEADGVASSAQASNDAQMNRLSLPHVKPPAPLNLTLLYSKIVHAMEEKLDLLRGGGENYQPRCSISKSLISLYFGPECTGYIQRISIQQRF